MILYFSLLFLVVLSIYIGDHSRVKHSNFLMYFVACSVLVAVAAVRNRHVGTDASYYANMFSNVNSFDDVVTSTLEPGYFFLCWIAHIFSDDYFSIFTLVALVVIACFAWVIYRYSVDAQISFFIFIVGGYYTIVFNGFRQGLANAIFFVAFGAIFRRNFVLYATCIAFAITFHKSAIIALPAYFFIIQKNNLRLNLLIFAIGGLSVYFFGILIDFGGVIDPRYAKYSETVSEGRGLVSFAFVVALCLFFIIFKKKIVKYRDMYDPLLNMFLLATTITVVSALHATEASGIRRLALYFSTSSILLWPILYANILERREKILFLFCFVTCYLLYYALTIRAFSNLVPYTLNPKVVDWLF